MTGRGYGPGDMEWQTAPGQAFDLEVLRAGTSLFTSRIFADAQGRLLAQINADAREAVDVRFVCR